MENAGEHLVGQYLQLVKECDFVQYNLQTKFVQGEIDVVGINSAGKIAYICEVAIHLETGLQYTKNNQPDNVDRFIKKFEKNVTYAEKNFEGYKKIYMLWTPFVRIPKSESVKHNQQKDIEKIVLALKKSKRIEIEAIYNEKFYSCILELRKIASKTTQEMTSPIMRFLQIEEKLTKHKN
jgi:hypothetical protein